MTTGSQSIQTNGSLRATHGVVPTGAISGVLVRGLDGLADLCLLTVIFVVPLMMAVISETGIALFVACSFAMSLAWAFRQLILPEANSRFSLALLIPLLGVALVAFQLVSVPQWLLHFASPFHKSHLEVWGQGGDLLAKRQSWSMLSVTPSLTRSGLVLLIAYSGFFLTLSQRLTSIGKIDRLLKLVAASTVLMAAIGLGQLFSGSEQFLWMFEHPFRTAAWPAKGTFTNQNHFAHFLALGIGPLAWAWKLHSASQSSAVKKSASRSRFGAQQKPEAIGYIIAGVIAVVVLTGFLSFSRGGISVILLASILSIVAVRRQLLHVVKFVIPVVAFVGLGLLVFGTEALEQKWNTITGAESMSDLSAGRFALWSALLDAFPHFWLAGSGIGSHAEVYPTWLSTDFGVRFSHAESGYFQILVEAGLLGISLVVAGIGCLCFWTVRAIHDAGQDSLRRTRVLVLFASVCATVLHSAVDFVWFIPACMIFATIIFAALFRTCQLYRETDEPVAAGAGWPNWLAMIVVLAAIPVGSLSADVIQRDMKSESSWLAYRKDAVAAGRSRVMDSQGVLDERLNRMVANLEKCIQEDPSDFRAMSELSALYLRRFEREQQAAENTMSLREIKNTVETSGFESQQEVAEWLRRAFGSHVVDLYRGLLMAENAVAGQPMRGESYLVLAQVGFLKEISPEEGSRLVEQAIRLRPYNAGVLYFAGLVEAEEGKVDAACQWWKKAFHQSKEMQPVILRGLEPHMSPAEIFGHLDPGLDAVWYMFDSYNRQENSENSQWVANYYRTKFSEVARKESCRDAEFWKRSEQIFSALDEKELSTECLSRAVKYSPGNLALRKRYAFALMSLGKTEIARRELKWCRLKSANDSEVNEALKLLSDPIKKGTIRGY